MEAEALWEEETQQTIGIFLRATLPWLMRLSKVSQRMKLLLQDVKFRKLRTVDFEQYLTAARQFLNG